MAKMSGTRFFAETLKGYGVECVFFVPAQMAPALAAMEEMPIRRIMTHGEKSAAYMADGYARASGKPGVCMAQHIGASNLAAGLRDAWLAGSPLIAISGGPTPESRYRNAYQEVEDFSQFDPVTKFNARVETVERMPDLLRQAFRAATTGAPGPVHLQLLSHWGQAMEAEADLDLIIESEYSRVPAFRPEPDAQRVAAAMAALTQARKPIIVAGGGVTRSGAQQEVVELAEAMQIPVITSLNAKSTLPDAHPLALGVSGTYSRNCANQALLESDLVFFIGSHTGGQVTHGWRFPARGCKVMQLDIDPKELGRNYPNTVSIVGDAKVTLQAMIDAAKKKPWQTPNSWRTRVRELVAEWRAEHEPLRTSDAVPLRPERICREISEALPANGVVVSDTGHSGIWTGSMIDFKYPTQRYIRCAGSLGWGFPGALGVKCALPDQPVVCFTGDTGFYYHIGELETARRHNIAAVIVVNNNTALNQEIKLNTDAYGGKPYGRWTEMWTFAQVDFAKIAEDFGCVGMRAETPDQLAAALKKAITLNKPVVIDAISDVNAVAKKVEAYGSS